MAEDSQWMQYARRFSAHPLRIEWSGPAPHVVVCIPVYAEPDLIRTLQSILSTDPVHQQVDVLLLFNTDHRMSDEERKVHQESWDAIRSWIPHHSTDRIQFIPVSAEMPADRRAGVGWARKLAMDTAALRLGHEGIILCLDADCTVAPNWLHSVITHFESEPDAEAASIYFEHDVSTLPLEIQMAIGQYELHLRYLRQAMQWSGHPFAFHTIGSAMAVRRNAYLRHGGMNTRQAGEDFYFLQKFIEVGTMMEIQDTIIFPSPRRSTRVPFGTGRAMLQFDHGLNTWMTIDPQSFRSIRPLFQQLGDIRLNILKGTPLRIEDTLIDLPDPLKAFLLQEDFDGWCRKIAGQTRSPQAFRKRFFRYFNAFRMIKYTHYMRDHAYPDIAVFEAAKALCEWMDIPLSNDTNILSMLDVFRRLDRRQPIRNGG